MPHFVLSGLQIAFSIAAAFQAPSPSPAASDPYSPLTINVTFEGYYEYNSNRPAGRLNLLRAYDSRANSFSIQQAGLVFESAADRSENHRFGVRVDLQFGLATEVLQGSTANEPRPDLYRPVWQAFGSYIFPGAHAIRLDFGKFASNLGYETNYAKDNNNFSRAFLFNFLPYYHQGARVTIPVTDRVSFMYLLTNGIQQSEDFNNFKSHHLAAILTPAKGLSWTVNYYFGQEQPDGGEPDGPDGWFRVFDTYVSYVPTATWSLGADVTHTTNQTLSEDPAAALNGFGGYARYQVSARSAASLRYERIADDGLFAGLKQKLQEVTATFEHKVDEGFIVRAEYRRDWSDTATFPGRSSTSPLNKAQNTALVGLVWWVGGKRGVW